jgi:hypothetical protein
VVEHVHAGAFDRIAAQDSFAMDDATSEEVQLAPREAKIDPRFARAMNGVEPATELLDREMLASIAAARTLTEDDLAEALRLPGEGRAPSAHLPTEKISRAALAAARLDELTVPSPHPAAGQADPSEVDSPDLTLPLPVKDIPQPPSIQQALSPTGSLPISGTRALGQAESNRPSTTPVPPQRLPSRPRSSPPPAPQATGPQPASTAQAPLAPVALPSELGSIQTLVPGGVPAAQAQTATVLKAAPAPREPEAPAREDDGDSVSLPIVGLVVAGSGGLVAVLAIGGAAIVVTLLVFFLTRGDPASDESLALPPIEIAPIEIVPIAAPAPSADDGAGKGDAEDTVEDPAEEPAPTRSRRPSPAPAPAPASDAPVPVLAPEPRSELPPDDLDLSEPEPEKKGGLFGKKKKN